MLTAILFIAGSYLWASIPTAYLVSRYKKGIDIRDYGSGNVGAANVIAHVGRVTGFLLGTFDCLGKGTLPVVLAAQLDQSVAVQAGVGLAAIAGHNWTPFLRFTGGRGVATAIGVVFGFQMWPEFIILAAVIGVLGRLMFNEVGFWTFFSMLALPVLTFLVGLLPQIDRPPEMMFMTLGIGALLMLKRVTANWEMPSGEYPLFQVVACRILWDRDIPKKLDWTRRRPSPEGVELSNVAGDDIRD